VALQLKRRGITRVHPLEGGIAGWMSRQYPVIQLAVQGTAAAESPRQ
jgi:rhodanese-related sulfurtransferase